VVHCTAGSTSPVQQCAHEHSTLSALNVLRPVTARKPCLTRCSVHITLHKPSVAPYAYGEAHRLLLPMEGGANMSTTVNPLVGPPPTEIALAAAPLARVLCQLRFPVIASIDKREYIGPFQEAIRREYPVLRKEVAQRVSLDAGASADVDSRVYWRFHDSEGLWRLTLCPDFLALETVKYTSRGDFLRRLGSAFGALQDHIGPSVFDRLGVRYVDRIEVTSGPDVAALIRPEVAGTLVPPLGHSAKQSLSHTAFELPDEHAMLTLRTGLVPPGATFDANAVDAIESMSWVLDLDAYIERTEAFDAEAALAVAGLLSKRVYAVFRWCVTDEFLMRFGGTK
jgi:uncharacterized protein (TIGR04255 family)